MTTNKQKSTATLAPRRVVSNTSSLKAKPAGKAANARPAPQRPAPAGKLGLLISMLRGPDGAHLAEMTAATGWQAHSVRGSLSGSIKKKLGYAVTTEVVEGRRIYRIMAESQA